MTITPLYPQSIGTYQGKRQWSDIGRHVGGIEECFAAHLFDTAGAGTGQTQRPSGEEALVTLLVPLNEDAIVTAGYGIGNG